MADDFNRFFANVGKSTFEKCHPECNTLFKIQSIDIVDTIALIKHFKNTISSGSDVDQERHCLALRSKLKFRNPEGALNETGAFKDTVKPLYWTRSVWELDPDDPDNNGYRNEDLIVWMRSAAFPTFRKLYRKIDHSQEGFINGLPADRYYLEVDYNYPVDSFGGKKRMILSTTSFLGGKNNFLGIAYITVGAICLLLGIIFLIIHIKFGKRAGDQLSINQNTPYSD
nr:cell cycle control protein 50A-like [Penaeus vannamei]